MLGKEVNMLERLIIRNLAVIEDMELELYPGLTVLSGETGAGKSMIVEALNLLLGGRATHDLIRTGADKAFVQGVFTTPNPNVLQRVAEQGEGIAPSGEVILTRELSQTRSVCRINGRVVTQAALKSVGEYLVDLHGQHEHQSLLYPARHLDILDKFLGEEGRILLQNVETAAKAYRQSKEELNDLMLDEKERVRMIDVLAFQIKDITSANLKRGEEEGLRLERQRLLYHEKLITAVERTFADLYDGQGKTKAVIDVLGKAHSVLLEASRHAEELLPTVALVEQATLLTQEVCSELSKFKDRLVLEPGRLNIIEERLDLIGRLKRKYGHSVEEVLSFALAAQENFDRINNSVESAARLQKLLHEHQQRYAMLSTDLRRLREEKGQELSRTCEAHLIDLGMKGSQLSVLIKPYDSNAISATGTETVEFLFTANQGESLKPLAKIASGGEISRVMLALKTAFTALDDISTLVFDEVDSGVGGKAAQSVAEKIALLSQMKQVICISHLASIAAFADNHYCVRKKVLSDKTVTEVKLLDREGRIKELARMLSGSESGVALNHAEEMLATRQKSVSCLSPK